MTKEELEQFIKGFENPENIITLDREDSIFLLNALEEEPKELNENLVKAAKAYRNFLETGEIEEN